MADSFFETADPGLDRVPIVPSGGRRAGYAHLTAVVYFGDSATTTVQAAWSGPVAGESKPQSGRMEPTSVLYFEAPKDAFAAGAERLKVTVDLSKTRTASVDLALGASWRATVDDRICMVLGKGCL